MTMPSAKKPLDQVREKVGYKHYSFSIERIYVSWIRRYVIFHAKYYPAEIGAAEVGKILVIYGHGDVFNLGYGISQFTPPENVKALIETVHTQSACAHQVG